MKVVNNILINRTDAMGDTILTMPMARLIKEQNSQINVSFLVNPHNAELLKEYHWVDNVITWDNSQSFFQKIQNFRNILQKHKIDSYIYVGGDQTLSFLAKFFRIPNRGGLKSRLISFFFLNYGVRQRRSNVEMHEIDYNLQLLRPFGIIYNKTILPKITLETSQTELNNSSTKRPYIVIHPGMSGHTLNWSAQQYAGLVSYIEKKRADTYDYFVSFTPQDQTILDEFRLSLADNVKAKVKYFDGSKAPLKDFMILLKESLIYIGGSTGPTHLANALDCTILTFFSPIKVQSALRWGPLGSSKRVKICVPHAICGETYECAGEKCLYFYCFSHMDVQSAFEEFEKLIFNKIPLSRQG